MMKRKTPRPTGQSASRLAAALMCALPLSLCLAATGAGTSSLKTTVVHQVVVQLIDTSPATMDAVLTKLRHDGFNVKVTDQVTSRPVYLLTIGKTRTAQAAVDDLNEWQDPRLEFAEVNQLVTSDPWLHDDSHAKLNSVLAIGDGATCIDGPNCEPKAVKDLLRLDKAHTQSTGLGVRVAVLDTGTDWNHPAFATVDFRAQYDFLDNDFDAMEGGVAIENAEDFGKSSVGHGTHVAGIVHRVAPDAQLMIGRILDPSGTGTTWLTAKGIFWAIDPSGTGQMESGAHVINLSLDTKFDTQVLHLAADVVTCAAVPARPAWVSDQNRCTGPEHLQAVVLAAAGNDATDKVKRYPAAYAIPGLIAVAASDNSLNKVRAMADFTNSGGFVDIAAPGLGILSQFFDDSHATISGTSMAAPMVSGLAALVKGLGPSPNDWSATAVVQRIKDRSVSMCGPGTPLAFKHIDVAGTVDGDVALGPCP